MIPGIVGAHISRSNRNLLIFNLVLLTVVAGVTWMARRPLYNFFMGPMEIDARDIPRLGDPNSLTRYWVKAKVDPSMFEDGGLKSSGRKKATTYYRVLRLPEGGLLVHMHAEEPGSLIEGSLSDKTTEVRKDVEPRLIRPFGPKLLGTVLETSEVRIGGWAYLAICGPLALLALWNIFKAISRMGSPAKHPVCAVLRRFGEPAEIAVAIDAEHRAGAQATGNVQLTQSWLMRKRAFGLDLLFLGDVVWAYKKETKHSTNGVPTGTTYSSMVYDKHGKLLDLGLKKDQTEQLLMSIHRNVPWVVLGFDKELETMWAKNRPALLQAVEARKEAYLAAASKAEAGAPPV